MSNNRDAQTKLFPGDVVRTRQVYSGGVHKAAVTKVVSRPGVPEGYVVCGKLFSREDLLLIRRKEG